MLTSATLYLLAVGAVTLLAWCWQPEQNEQEPTEFSATFDALAAERDESARVKARALAHERAMLAADAALLAKYGRQHDPVEL